MSVLCLGVAKKDWAFRAELEVEEEMKRGMEKAELEFEGLDTFAVVYLVSFFNPLPTVLDGLMIPRRMEKRFYELRITSSLISYVPLHHLLANVVRSPSPLPT